MKLYAIRRPMGWKTPEDLAEAAKLSARVGDEEMSSDIRWIRSYVVIEADGSLGTICIYEASSRRRSASTLSAQDCLRRRSGRSPTR